ncbi:MAG: molybdopterin-dependent oxidoreductase, partial [Betaproteobacteria bacterium]|nr:molybdopterin-dependent oxidoreductase [Betaproteobacteria bacterium]
AQSPATLSLYCQGLNQSASGTDKNAALINLHLATGQIGKPGAGPFSLTGQPNAMGGREVGGMATLLSAHRDLSNAAHRAEVAALWGVPDVPAAPGKTAVEMFEAAADGEIRALWVACTNPAQSLPDQATVRRALQRAEFVVLQDCATHTATAPYADLLLPATTWGEKEGTVTNSERCISRVRAAVPAPGEAWHDWQIAAAFAQRLAPQLGRAERAAMFAYTTPEQVWAEHRSSTRGRDLDITGLSYAQLEQQPQQWPFVPGATQGRARLYEDGVFATDDGRARFAAVPYRPVAEPRDARFPVALNTGRLRDQWHGGSRTGTLGRLFAHTAEPSVQLNPQDMARRGLAAGDLVHVTSRRGSQILPAQPDSGLAPAQAFIAMHWGEEFVGGAALSGALTFGVNTLTQPVCCPHSRQPELKHAAVKVLKAELPWRLLALAWLPEAQALTTVAQLRRAAGQWAYVACVPLTDSAKAVRTGVLLRAAAYAAPPAAQLDEIERLLALDGPALLRYRDPRRELRHVMRVASGRLDAVLLTGDTQAEAWLKPLLQDEAPLGALGRDIGRALLAPGARAPHAGASRGAQVCNCHNVWAAQIDTVLARCTGDAQQRLATLQGALQCGTSCGSCLPELRRRVRSSLPEAVDTA